MAGIKRFLSDNSLSIVFFVLFLLFLLGQYITGYRTYDDTRLSQGLSSIGYVDYLGTGQFLDGIFANWQAAILQLGSLIVFSIFLFNAARPTRKNPRGRPERPLRSTTFQRCNPLSGGTRSRWRSSASSLFALFYICFLRVQPSTKIQSSCTLQQCRFLRVRGLRIFGF